jgi:hypothetical protein
MTQRRPIGVGKVLIAAAVIGTVAGVVLSELRGSPAARVKVPAPPALVVAAPPMNKGTPAPKPDEEMLRALPPYPHAKASPRPLISQAKGQGGELKAAWFATDDTPEEVISFYERTLKKLTPLVVSHRFSPHAGYAGYLDGDFERMHLISVVRQGRETLVFPSVSDPIKMVDRAGQSKDNFPMPTGARLSFDIGEPGAQRAYVVSAADTSVRDVMDFYKRSLAQQGWTVQSAEEHGPRGHVEATRAKGSAAVSVQQRGVDVAIAITFFGEV